MTWSEFLHTIENRNHQRVTLVGPLNEEPFAPKEPTVFVDGGVNFRDHTGSAVCVSVGDGDSAAVALDEVLPTHKDFSDLAFVLRHLPANIRRLELHGFLGGRRDHEWANLGEIHKFLAERAGFASANLYSPRDLRPSVIAFAQGALRLDVNGGFSVLVFEPEHVKLVGACEYKLDGKTQLAAASSHGISNIGRGPIEVTSAKPCFVFLFDSKS